MSTSQTRARARIGFCAAFAGLVAVPAWADGELDPGFGANGVVKIAFPNAPAAYVRDVAVVNGVIEAAGLSSAGDPGCTQGTSLLIVQLSLSGSVVGAPSSYPLTAVCPGTVSIDPATGDVYVIGTDFVGRFDSSGHNTWGMRTGGAKGSYCVDTAVDLGRGAVDSQGRLVGLCSSRTATRLLRVDAQDATFYGLAFPLLLLPTVITQDPASGAYYFAGTNPRYASTPCPSGAGHRLEAVGRLTVDTGALDTSWGSAGAAVPLCLDSGYVGGIAVDTSGSAIIGGRRNAVAADQEAFGFSGYVARIDPTGMPDPAFGSHGVVFVRNMIDGIADVRADGGRRVYALGAGSTLLRLKADGTADATFGSSSDVQTLNGPNSRWQSLQFADNSESSMYLIGGAWVRCYSGDPCPTTAVIARVTLTSAGSAGMTTTVLNSSSTTLPAAQALTLTATVTGTSPTGTVAFKDGSATLRTVQLIAGRASFGASSLAVGSHGLTAVYGGDGHNPASTSQEVTQTITPAISTTVLNVSAAYVYSGQPVTFTATVTGMSPTGTVAFSDGSTTLGTASVSSGSATLRTSLAPAGDHTILAAYSGDSGNAPSTSASIAERVFDAPPSQPGGGGSVGWLDLGAIVLAGLRRVLRRASRVARSGATISAAKSTG